ncbi:MAG: molecular chaperone DnaJ, partial [Candidatus Pacebacteria bacterium]|nr:molecular chaperone DnaJ [Candidatus Paceibacterota bacterium]
MDYYKILEVSSSATEEEIKKAYRKLAHKYHPDRGGDDKKFKEINEAYQILSNKEKRAQYDKYGRVFDGNQNQGFDGFDFGFWKDNFNQQGFNFDGNIEDLFSSMFGFGGKNEKSQDLKKGNDLEIEIQMELKDVLREQIKKINIEKFVECQRCKGSGAEEGSKINECATCRGVGRIQEVKRTILGSISHYTTCPNCKGEGYIPEKPCNVCKGEGRVRKSENIEIRILAGVDTDQVIKYKGMGDAGRKNGKSGDLYVRIFVKPHPELIRRGDDIYTSSDISISEAALGGDINIKTLDKEILLRIPSGTESGKTFRIAKHGIPKFGSLGKGDFYVRIQVRIPRNLTRKQKELLNELKKEGI